MWLLTIVTCAIVLGTVGTTMASEKNSPKISEEVCKALDVIVVYDNNPHHSKLESAWGFSCVVRCNRETILFDTGGSSAILLSNMEKLQIDLKKIDLVVLSHLHGDHTGGLAGFLEKNNQVTVYLPKSFPKSFKDGIKSYGTRIEEVDVSREIASGVYTTGEIGERIKEQSLIIRTPEGLVVLTGCAHPGIVRVLEASRKIVNDKIYLTIGGFHLGGIPISQLKNIIHSFERLEVEKVAPCHCTGEEARSLFQKYFGRNYIEAGVGKIIPIAN